jgi:hypothetical protein
VRRAAGFRVLEAGAGTGGLTKDALPLFDCNLHHELLRYCATDITSAFSAGLLDAVKSPKLMFKARLLFLMHLASPHSVVPAAAGMLP